MDRNMLDRDQQRYSNMMGRNLMHQDSMGRNMMGRNIYNIMSNRGMTSDMSNLMGQQMNSNMMGRNAMGHRDMTPNMMYGNMMGQDMIDGRNQMSAMNSNNGQVLMQRMEMERVPETYT